MDLYADAEPLHPPGIPYRCDCGGPISLQTQTDGPKVGMRYYGCELTVRMIFPYSLNSFDISTNCEEDS